MSDKMPEDLYVRRVGKKKFSAVNKESPLALGGFVAFNEARPPKPRMRYVRAALPKEVDLFALKIQVAEKMCGCSEDRCNPKNVEALDHLVAPGVIKDINVKPAENKGE